MLFQFSKWTDHLCQNQEQDKKDDTTWKKKVEAKTEQQQISMENQAKADKAQNDAVAAMNLEASHKELVNNDETIIGTGGKDAMTKQQQINSISNNIK